MSSWVVAEDLDTPKLGKFIRATRAIAKGELLLQETPILCAAGPLHRSSQHELAMISAAASIREAGLFLPTVGAPGYPILQQLQHQGLDQDDYKYVRGVLHFNSFAAGIGGCDQVVFRTLARANHSCQPNCLVDGDDGTLRAIRSAQTGEMLTVSYLDDAVLLLPRERRRQELSARWGFWCECLRCSAEIDDVRRFRSCKSCTGDLLRQHAPFALTCVACGVNAPEADARALLTAEITAEQALERARNGDLEEEDEGVELMRCLKFTSKHPDHFLSMELSNEFMFPEPEQAYRILLDGLTKVFGSSPCQLAVLANRELAKLLAQRGDRAGARACEETAASVACILDGESDKNKILEEWHQLQGREITRGTKEISADVQIAQLLEVDKHVSKPKQEALQASSQNDVITAALPQSASTDLSSKRVSNFDTRQCALLTSIAIGLLSVAFAATRQSGRRLT